VELCWNVNITVTFKWSWKAEDLRRRKHRRVSSWTRYKWAQQLHTTPRNYVGVGVLFSYAAEATQRCLNPPGGEVTKALSLDSGQSWIWMIRRRRYSDDPAVYSPCKLQRKIPTIGSAAWLFSSIVRQVQHERCSKSNAPMNRKSG